MKKVNTSPISGMQELLPETQAIFNRLKSQITTVYHAHGFQSIETPIIDRTEILFAKAGGDTEKQIYRVVKTAESADSADQALRFDHTVPLARYVVEHENNLNFPFKVTQIARNFRGERAQKGRFRELYQCDIDIIGRGSLPIAYDTDVISTLIEAFKSFSLTTPVLARISNRKILSGLIESLNLESLASKIYDIIDHSEKVPLVKTQSSFAKIGLSPEHTDIFMNFVNIAGDHAQVISRLQSLNIQNELYQTGITELHTVLSLLESQGYASLISADMRIVRGLDYYTGTVFEFILPEYKQIGSVCGGGRYENLASHFTDQSLPGVGGSIGLTRLFYILNEYHLLSTQPVATTEYAIIPISPAEYPYAFKVAASLHRDNHSATVVLTDKKLGDKLSYAAKIATNGIVIGDTEVVTGNLSAKNFTTKQISNLTVDA